MDGKVWIPVGLIGFVLFSAVLWVMRKMGIADNERILGLPKFVSAVLLIVVTLALVFCLVLLLTPASK